MREAPLSSRQGRLSSPTFCTSHSEHFPTACASCKCVTRTKPDPPGCCCSVLFLVWTQKTCSALTRALYTISSGRVRMQSCTRCSLSRTPILAGMKSDFGPELMKKPGLGSREPMAMAGIDFSCPRLGTAALLHRWLRWLRSQENSSTR